MADMGMEVVDPGASLFLEEQRQRLQEELATTERRIVEAEQAGRAPALLEARRTYLQRERAVLEELADEIAKQDLEQALGARLRHLQEAMYHSLPRHTEQQYYTQRFWEQEVEQEILNDLLQRWLSWKHRFASADD